MSALPKWLLKSEPTTYSWDDLVKDGGTRWDGIRNPTARMHLRAMAEGDRAFLYHSSGPKTVVAVVSITKAAYPDPKDPAWAAVDIAPVEPLPREVSLAELKADKQLQDMVFVRQGRLSVSPVTPEQARALLAMAKRTAKMKRSR